MGEVEFEWGGEQFIGLSDRALWWARRRTLCIADLHLGKAAAFRRAGVPVPEAATERDLARLTDLVRRYRPERLVVLGDLLHSRSGRAPQTMEAFGDWRSAVSGIHVLLIRGNHDEHAGDPPSEWDLRVADGPFAEPGDALLAFAHDPDAIERSSDSSMTLCGHLHPAVMLDGPAHGMRAPCFWFRERIGVLPAFGSFTGAKAVRPSPPDRVLVVGGDGEIMDVSRPRVRVRNRDMPKVTAPSWRRSR